MSLVIREGDLDSASGGPQEFTVSVPERHWGVPSLARHLCLGQILWVTRDLPSTGGELTQPDGPYSNTKAMEQGAGRTSWRSLCCEPGYRVTCRGSYRRANMDTVSLAQKKRRISRVPKTVRPRCSRPCSGRLPFPRPPSWPKRCHGSPVWSPRSVLSPLTTWHFPPNPQTHHINAGAWKCF